MRSGQFLFRRALMDANPIHEHADELGDTNSRGVVPLSRAWMKGAIPFGRLADADDVAEAVMFLASDESSFVGGAELMVDGGFVAV